VCVHTGGYVGRELVEVELHPFRDLRELPELGWDGAWVGTGIDDEADGFNDKLPTRAAVSLVADLGREWWMFGGTSKHGRLRVAATPASARGVARMRWGSIDGPRVYRVTVSIFCADH